MNAEPKGFSITPPRVLFVLSLIALITFGWKIAAHAVTQEMTITAHGEYITEDKANTKEVLLELKDLNRKVDHLFFIISNGDPKQPVFGSVGK